MFELAKGNLLEAEVEALVNTVNTEGVMGKGIALQFKKKFPAMFEAYQQACKAGEIKPGHMHVYERVDMLNPRYIINFPTKRHWRSPARIEDIRSGLLALGEEIRKRNIQSIAVPPLGCGNGGLDWAEVLPIIQHELGSFQNVKVLVYPPAGAPEAGEISHKTERPEMNISRAIVLKIWRQYFALGYQLTLLEVHKLLYFLQEAGENLRLRFEKGTYGPYADNLRHLLHRFEGHFTLGFGDGRNKPDTQIELLRGSAEAAYEFLTQNAEENQESLRRLSRVAELIEGFESPYGMELLATVHWAARHEGAKAADLGSIEKIVHSWSPRKQKLMKREHLELALKRLSEKGWLN
ncbi:MAG TPA: macro domain-containing protein [Candidatus Acidoferrales bacterium]|jgi:O-acetyl-ADP-ribose deacetylase (regulator of RNase III)|nr:macro domain-containing protein [Candidatus Acidoferrales bacterium]